MLRHARLPRAAALLSRSVDGKRRCPSAMANSATDSTPSWIWAIVEACMDDCDEDGIAFV